LYFCANLQYAEGCGMHFITQIPYNNFTKLFSSFLFVTFATVK
jgi:hypothetical protein